MMEKTVVLEFKGNLEQQGFYVTLHIVHANHHVKTNHLFDTVLDGYLPPSLDLSAQLIQWQTDYRRLAMPMRSLKPYKLKFDGKIHPLDVCLESAQQLVHTFQQWLRSASFHEIDLQLRQALMPTDTVCVLIRSSNLAIQALPWHLWDFVEQYPNAEIALSSVRAYSIHQDQPSDTTCNEGTSSSSDPSIHVLAVIGDCRQLDVENDRRSLNQLAGAHVEFLVEPSQQQLHDKLYERFWNILLFAGHSQTKPEGQGILRLNSTTDLSIDDIRYAIRRAIHQGLQLAIFNSCDGLGLAQALADLQLPHMIVMREAVPDQVAQQFLSYLLTALTQGQPLHLAAREARERLQSLEKIYPCASWLPIVYQQPNAPSWSWSPLETSETNLPSHISTSIASNAVSGLLAPAAPQQFSVRRFVMSLSLSVLASGMLIGLRSLGWLQNWELNAYDQMMRLRPGQNVPDDRILVVAVGEEDIQYQRAQGMAMQGSLSDEALSVLLQKIVPYQPSVIGLDIIHDFAFEPQLQSQLAQQNLIAICQARSGASALPAVAPPPDFPLEQLGFNDLPIDPDRMIRRQFLGRPADDVCQTEESFNFRIAQVYLQQMHEISVEWVASSSDRDVQIQLGYQTFPRLTSDAGSYQLSPGEAGGYQILVNYRSASPEIIHLREILSGAMDAQLAGLIRDRILLIGVVNPQVDVHQIPYHEQRQSNSTPGVIVQANMVSQIISAALDERPILSWWPEWAEILWISSWTILGSIVIAMSHSSAFRLSAVLLSLIVLWGICFVLFVEGIWIPFVPSALGFGLTVLSCLVMYQAATRKLRSH